MLNRQKKNHFSLLKLIATINKRLILIVTSINQTYSILMCTIKEENR